MESKKVNTGDLLVAMRDYHEARTKAEYTLNHYVGKLFDSLQTGINAIEEGDLLNGGSVSAVINEGYDWIENPFVDDDEDHVCKHVSKDLWKGFILGVVCGNYDSNVLYNAFLDFIEKKIEDGEEFDLDKMWGAFDFEKEVKPIL